MLWLMPLRFLFRFFSACEWTYPEQWINNGLVGFDVSLLDKLESWICHETDPPFHQA
jgi:hypothetical protein